MTSRSQIMQGNLDFILQVTVGAGNLSSIRFECENDGSAEEVKASGALSHLSSRQRGP